MDLIATRMGQKKRHHRQRKNNAPLGALICQITKRLVATMSIPIYKNSHALTPLEQQAF